MWEYGEPFEGFNRLKFSCKLYGAIIFGGVSCLKYHLAKILGHDMDICNASTPKIVHVANQSKIDMIRKIKQKQELRIELVDKATRNKGTKSYSWAWET